METIFKIRPAEMELPPITERMAEVMRMYGMTADRLRGRPRVGECEIALRRGQIAMITGFSGSGKTTVLTQMAEQVPEDQRLWLGQGTDEEALAAASVIDAMGGEALESLRQLAQAGLSDARIALQRPDQLSRGQYWRFQLARALTSTARYVFMDEFAATLDAINAATVSHRLRRIADRSEKIFIVASGRYDFACDLSPDVTVELRHGGEAIVRPRALTPVPRTKQNAWIGETWLGFYGRIQEIGDRI